MKYVVGLLLAVVTSGSVLADEDKAKRNEAEYADKFRQLEEVLPTPNLYRAGSGAPGHAYWQQRADYKISVTLDDARQRLTGSETITYHNHSPDSLNYIWLQMDQNRFRRDSIGVLSGAVTETDKIGFAEMRTALTADTFAGGYNLTTVALADGTALDHVVNDTMMRIDLPAPLAPGASISFDIAWSHNIIDADALDGRGGYEYFKDDDNYLYEIAQWYPRVAAYTDQGGWNNKQFVGNGEFTLEFGDFDVSITVPADHVVSATGELVNAGEVLTDVQQQRLADAKTAEAPVFIVTPDEARASEKTKSKDTKTWHFKAENVRDFAFATSRKFIWDAQGYHQASDGRDILTMSFYPKEAQPLWDQYSTASIIHTLKVYSRFTFPYPYPTAQSVHGPIGGMEYPMLSFNGYRPTTHDDGTVTYSRRTKYGLISVIIHEVGHNYFPMIVNSDERQWMWMDEGLNTFVQSIAKREWEDGNPTKRAEPAQIVDYMLSANQVPIMSNSEQLRQFGNNGYGKPSIALNILRETIMGRELFDFAFREYARRWMFKRPYPADFFRTMEDASAMDLDWFWRGWFYTTDHTDIAIDRVIHGTIDTENPDIEEPVRREMDLADGEYIAHERYRAGDNPWVDRVPGMLDFYNEHDEYTVTDEQREDYQDLLEKLDDWEKELLTFGGNVYFIDFSNIGGLVMPLILNVTYADGSSAELRLPAEIWRKNAVHVTKMLVTEQEITSLTLDPHLETADVDLDNNHWPRKARKTRLELYKSKKTRDLMRHMQQDEKSDN